MCDLYNMLLLVFRVSSKHRRYSSCWYKASRKLQKIVMLVMMKSLYPSFLSAGKVYIFSLQSFTMVKQELL